MTDARAVVDSHEVISGSNAGERHASSRHELVCREDGRDRSDDGMRRRRQRVFVDGTPIVIDDTLLGMNVFFRLIRTDRFKIVSYRALFMWFLATGFPPQDSVGTLRS